MSDIIEVSKTKIEALQDETFNKITNLNDLVHDIVVVSDDLLFPKVKLYYLNSVRQNLIKISKFSSIADMVTEKLFEKIESEVDCYPITGLLDIMTSINEMIDRERSLMAEVLKMDLTELANASKPPQIPSIKRSDGFDRDSRRKISEAVSNSLMFIKERVNLEEEKLAEKQRGMEDDIIIEIQDEEQVDE